jgi:hypothetical protein
MHYVANTFYDIACGKGWYERKFYWLSFLLGIVGWLAVTALPDRNPPKSVVVAPAAPEAPKKETYSDELPPL